MAFHLTTMPIHCFVFLLLISGLEQSECANFTIVNDCKENIWPGITPEGNFIGDGFALKPGQTAVFTAPIGWHGRIWGRTGCNFDKNGNGTCETGSCGNTLKCAGPGQPPASLADISLQEGIQFYDVSLVDGFNLPITVTPINGKGNCSIAGCDSDLRTNCPSGLAAKSNGKTIACRSACNVFNTDEYCCRGAFSDSNTCLPTNYSRTFKAACPAAYSYAFDDPTSVITCSATDYVVTFCSARNQTQCTYHDRQLSCSKSNDLKASFELLLIVIVALPTMMNIRAIF